MDSVRLWYRLSRPLNMFHNIDIVHISGLLSLTSLYSPSSPLTCLFSSYILAGGHEVVPC